MTSFTQTVEIPADRRLYLELPEDAPSGNAEVRVMFNVSAKSGKEAKKSRKTSEFDEFFGCFKDRDIWEEDGVTTIRKIRDEW